MNARQTAGENTKQIIVSTDIRQQVVRGNLLELVHRDLAVPSIEQNADMLSIMFMQVAGDEVRSARAFRRGGPVAGDRDWRAARQAHSAAGDALIGAAIMVAVRGRVPTVQ